MRAGQIRRGAGPVFTLRESAGAGRVRTTMVITMQRRRSGPARTVLAVLGTLATGGLVLLLRRRRRAPAGGAGRGPDDGGGLAGVREPRRPLPTDLVGAAAATSGE